MSKQGSLEIFFLFLKIGGAWSEHLQTYMQEPIVANIKAHSTFFRSDIMVELPNWLPELFLVIDIKIEYSRTNWPGSSAEIRVKPRKVGSPFGKGRAPGILYPQTFMTAQIVENHICKSCRPDFAADHLWTTFNHITYAWTKQMSLV